MSATAGTSLSGLSGVGTPSIVGVEKPEWDIPGHGISDKLRGFLMRVDAGESGLNAAEDMPSDVIDEMRRMVNAGILKPKNQAAMNYARAQGGLRAGDQSLLGPIIDGMPEGLTPEYWAVVIQKAQQVANERLAIMNETGYFEGVPTMDRQKMEADITNQIAQTEIARRLADNTIRSTDLDEAYRRDNMAQDMRQNIIQQFGYDPGPQGAAGVVGGNPQATGVAGADGVPPMPGSPEAQANGAQPGPGGPGGAAGPGGPGGAPGGAPGGDGVSGSTGAARPNMTMAMGEQVGWQYVPGSGWMQTIAGQNQDLATQGQAFTQQQAQAALASNPRNYIEAQMMGGSRGGLGGFAPTNQVTPTTQSPTTWNQMAGGMPGANIGSNVGNFAPGAPGMPGAPGAPGQTEPMMQAAVMGGTATPEQQAERMRMLQQGLPTAGNPQLTPEQQAVQQQLDQFQQAPAWQQLQAQMQQQFEAGDMAGAEATKAQMEQQIAPLKQQWEAIAPQPSLQPMGGELQRDRIQPWGMPSAQPGGMQAMPEGGRQAAMQQLQQQRLGAMGQMPGQANLGQAGGVPPTGQALSQQGFQAPGVGGMGMQGMQGPGRQPGQPMGPQGMPQQTAANQVGISAFANSLNKNRLVPGSGAMNGQGAFKTMQQIGQETNPQKWRTQDFMRGNNSERQGAMATASAAGFEDADTQDMLKKNLPSFKAPGAGAMV